MKYGTSLDDLLRYFLPKYVQPLKSPLIKRLLGFFVNSKYWSFIGQETYILAEFSLKVTSHITSGWSYFPPLLLSYFVSKLSSSSPMHNSYAYIHLEHT